jgi:hypothetical protein
VVFVFDPLGDSRPRPPAPEQLGVRDLESSEGSQFLSTARSVATQVWESRLRLLCCCLPQDESHRAAFSSIAQLVSGFFSVRKTSLCGTLVLSLTVSLSLYTLLSLSVSLSVCLCPSLSLSVALSLSLCVSLSVSVSLSLFVCLSPFIYLT